MGSSPLKVTMLPGAGKCSKAQDYSKHGNSSGSKVDEVRVNSPAGCCLEQAGSSLVAFVGFSCLLFKIPFLSCYTLGQINSKFHPSGTILFMFFVAGN